MDNDLDDITGISRLMIWMNYNDLTLISPGKRRFRSGSIFILGSPKWGVISYQVDGITRQIIDLYMHSGLLNHPYPPLTLPAVQIFNSPMVFGIGFAT